MNRPLQTPATSILQTRLQTGWPGLDQREAPARVRSGVSQISSPGHPNGLETCSKQRSGFSLMEVILATAILLGSVVVLSELAGMGRRQSLRGRDLSEAQRLCEQTLTELLTGIRPVEPLEQEPLLPTGALIEDGFSSLEEEPLSGFSEAANPFAFEEEAALPEENLLSENAQTPRWLHSIRIAPLESQPGLAVLTVVVEQSPEVAANPLRFELSRWIDDPLQAEGDMDRMESRPLDLAQGTVPAP